MPIETLLRGHLSTLSQSAEITKLQLPKEVDLAPGVGTNSYLEGTGFNLFLEMSRLVKNYNQNLKEGKDSFGALVLSVSELEVNIRTFIVEYIKSGTVLPHVNRIEEIDGAVRMVGQNGVPVISGITSAERYGSTLEASQKTEDFLTTLGLKKSPNRMAVINSPLGHSGLISGKGEVINYKNNQTMVFWTDETGDLHGLTLVSDLKKEQPKQLSVSLGIEENLLSAATKEEIASIVANPALFSYGRSIINPARYVFEKILAIRGNSDIRLEQEDGTVEYRSVAQTWVDIERFDSLLKFSPVWEDFLKRLKETIIHRGNNKLTNPFVQSQIAKLIEETILEITVDYLQEIKSKKFNVSPDNVIYFKPAFELKCKDQEIPPVDKYAVAAAFLQTRAGCAGGGKSSVSSLSGVSLGSAISGGIFSGGSLVESDQYGSLEFQCPKCKSTNRRPIGQLIPSCQHCHADVRC